MTMASTAAGTWRIDPVHSTVEFGVTHMPFSLFHARFREFESTMLIAEAEPANSPVTATIAAASIDVLDERFQAVMQSEDFFDTARWPALTFLSTAVERVVAWAAGQGVVQSIAGQGVVAETLSGGICRT